MLDAPKRCRYTYPMGADPDLTETSQCLCLASRRAARAITRAFDRELRCHGLRATQFSLLAILELTGAQTIGVLAGKLGADRTTLTRNLERVETRGLVTVRPGEDARSRIVAITATGRETLIDALPAWRRTQAAVKGVIGEETAEGLHRVGWSTRL
jgi:DNA-binding MarR family transcriptional regulator